MREKTGPLEVDPKGAGERLIPFDHGKIGYPKGNNEMVIFYPSGHGKRASFDRKDAEIS
jgi:hypothetical protein